MTAAAVLALSPQAAVAKKPLKAKDRGAKVEGKAKPDSAQQRCRDERKALGAGPFAAKYGKARTKGSAKAKAKAARAAFGRCVAQTTKVVRAEREAAEAEAELEAEEEYEAEEQDIDEQEWAGEDDDAAQSDDDDAAGELPHRGKHGAADAPGGKHAGGGSDDADEDEDDGDDDDEDEDVAPVAGDAA